ncbi:hypothetical protein ACF0H5_015016 [Mactra antiquata]
MKLTQGLYKIKNVVCGISGGVDSAVSALILKMKGYNVQGLFMKNWDSTNEHGVCVSDVDREDATYVCQHLDIPLYEVNFVKEYWNDVFSNFLQDLHQGKTPNPDVLCNKHIKFNAFYNYAIDKLNADAIATGHYVRTSAGYNLEDIDENQGVNLLKAVDGSKCQTLFLSQIPQKSLHKALFPVGEMLKQDVKKLACEAGLHRIANRKESMGICFIGKRNFRDFLEEYIDPQPGDFIDLETGNIVGRHNGIHNWTVGQRSLIAGLAEAFYIADKDIHNNNIYVVRGTHHPALYTQTLFTEEAYWINKPPRQLLTEQMYDCDFRYQHIQTRQGIIKCTLTLSGGNSLIVSLDKAVRALNAGQYAVFYDGDICLGSAKIRRAGPSLFTLGHEGRKSEHG